MTEEEAKTALRNGAYAAFLQVAIGIIVMLVAMQQNTTSGILSLYNDPTTFIDIILIVICGFGMLKGWRAAPIVAIILVIIGVIVRYFDFGSVRGLLFSVIYIYFFTKAAEGAFALHRLKRAENPDMKRFPLWAKIVTGIAGLAVAGVMTVGVLATTGVVIAVEVHRGQDMTGDLRSQLEQVGVLIPDEQVEYYYLFGFTDPMESGLVLTENALVFYQRDEAGDIGIYEMQFSDIGSVIQTDPGSVLVEAEYELLDENGEMMLHFPLGTEKDLDEDFIAALNKHVKNVSK